MKAFMPATEKLFEMREESDPKKKLFNKKWAQTFHHSAAQGLFITTTYCQNIWTEIALLCIRVKCPDEDDWGKIKRMLRLGCKFWRNSRRSFCSVPDSRVFWSGMFRLRFRCSDSFSLTHFHTSAD